MGIHSTLYKKKPILLVHACTCLAGSHSPQARQYASDELKWNSHRLKLLGEIGQIYEYIFSIFFW